MQFLAIAVLVMVFSALGRAEPFEAEVFPLDEGAPLLFHLKRFEETRGSVSNARAVFRTPDGNEVVFEDAEFEKGVLKRYSIDQRQLNEKGLLEIRDGKVIFSYTRNGKTSSSEEKLTPNLIIAPTTIQFIQDNWDALVSGKKVLARFAVLDRRETVGFDFEKTGETVRSGQETFVIRMEPTAFVISLIVKPLKFYFSKSKRQLVEQEGRTLPKRKKGEKFVDLDAHIFYYYSQ